MMGDVLSDAVVEIENYQAQYPQYYGVHYAAIEVVKAAMNRLRVILDLPPLALLDMDGITDLPEGADPAVVEQALADARALAAAFGK